MNEQYIKQFIDKKEEISIYLGFPLLYGTNYIINGMNFNIPTKYGHTLKILLYEKDSDKLVYEITCPEKYKIGTLFSIFIDGINWKDYSYSIKILGPKGKDLFFDENNNLLDPYANRVIGMDKWGERKGELRSYFTQYEKYMINDCPKIPKDDLIIYEVHVRGFTINDKNNIAPGTYKGLEAKIPYLKDLGVNCIELMPIFEFDENQNNNINPFTKEPLKNYWGYNTVSFYSPKASYAYEEPVKELQNLINTCHKNNIEVILDVVFNHTAEMGNDGPILSFRGLDNKTFYMLDENGEPYNFTGCGNTVNCNNPVVREFIINCLKYWRSVYSVDGFRFDLASVMSRDEKGYVLNNPPLVEQISSDNILADCKLIAEPWDASGLYQLGNFYNNNRWMEWNGKYRDDVRSFLNGHDNIIAPLMKRINGSEDIYGDSSLASINFISCHDGFTLNDIFSYNSKHNEANGENNRDGNDYNISCNYGIEGPTEDKEINFIRNKQIKNALTILFMSKGVPMFLMGDECGRSQKGNNNAYCQDNEISWFDWLLLEKNKDIFEYTKTLIKLRKDNIKIFNNPIKFHGVLLNKPDTSSTSHTLAWELSYENKKIYIAINLYEKELSFELPKGTWNMILSNDDNVISNNSVKIKPFSSVVLTE